jgi:hypothetical protein
VTKLHSSKTRGLNSRNASYDADNSIFLIFPIQLLCNSRPKYTDIIMLVIMSRSEKVSLTLWEEQGDKEFEKLILRRIFNLRVIM